MITATMQSRIVKELSALIELPLWGATRALNMEMFNFGERRSELNRAGKRVDVGDYSLHVQCPWRIVGANGIVVGSGDRNYPEDESADRESFDSEGPSRCEAKIGRWLREHSVAPLAVERVDADNLGGFTLFLQDGFLLDVFPNDSLRGEYSEHWRLFEPSKQKRHFVVCGYGIEK